MEKKYTIEDIINLLNKNQELENKNQELENKNQELENKCQNLENENQNLKINNKQLEAEMKNMHEKYQKLLKKYEDKLNEYQLQQYNEFYKKSEKLPSNVDLTKDENILNEAEASLEQAETKENKKIKRKRKPQIEQFVNDLKNMVDETRTIDYDFESNNVDRNKVKTFGQDESIKIEAEIKFNVVKIIRPKYKDKNKIYQALSEDIFPHSILTPSLASNIINFKYRLGVPLYRYKEILNTRNIIVSEADISNYVTRTANILMPIYNKIKEELLKLEMMHIDETTLEVIDVTNKSNCYMFIYRSSLWAEKQISYYEFNVNRTTDKVGAFLEGYKGYVICDGYPGYDFLEEKGIRIQRCWVHIRRYFFDCVKILPKAEQTKHPAYEVIKNIKKLFDKEASFKKNNYIAEKIKEERNGIKYKAILKDIDDSISKISVSEVISGNLEKAVNYYNHIKEKNELYTFLENGKIDIDNNIAERTVKPFVIGRKNFLFCKTEKGAETTALCYTIVQTALNNNVDPEKYIKYALENINKKKLEEIMPWSQETLKVCKMSFEEKNLNPVLPKNIDGDKI